MRRSLLVFSCLLLALAFQAPALAQVPPRQSAAIEFRELSPEARRLLVDEIRIQLQADSDQKWNLFFERLARWGTFGSAGVGVLAALLGIIGWRGFANLRTSIRSDMKIFAIVDEDFRRSLNQKITESVSEVSEIAVRKSRAHYFVARLELLSARLEADEEGVAHSHIEPALELISEILTEKEVASGQVFATLVASVLKRFTEVVNMDPYLDRMDDMVRDIITRDRPSAIRMFTHYADRMLEEQEPGPALLARYRVYEEPAKAYEQYKWTYYALLLAFKPEGKGAEKAVRTLIKTIRFLKPPARKALLHDLMATAARPMDSVNTPRFAAEVELVAAFMASHGEEVRKQYSSEELTEVAQGLHPGAPEMADEVA